MSKRKRKGNKSRKKKKVKAPERDPDSPLRKLLFLKEAIDKSYEEVPKSMTENDMIRWIRDTINKTTPPRQVGVRPNFAAGEEAQAVAYGRRLQDLTPTPTPIPLIKSSSSYFKGKLFKGGKKRKTRRFKKKRRKRLKRRRKSTRKRR